MALVQQVCILVDGVRCERLKVWGVGCRVHSLHERVDGEFEVLSGGVDSVLGRTALEDALEDEDRVWEAGPGDRVIERGTRE